MSLTNHLSIQQLHQFPAVVSVRAVPSLLELLLSADRAAAADPECVANGSLHDAGAVDFHPVGQRHQGDHRGLCE